MASKSSAFLNPIGLIRAFYALYISSSDVGFYRRMAVNLTAF